MAALLLSRRTLVWLALIVATALSWKTSKSTALNGAETASVILVIAFAKVLAVAFEFMELRTAPWAYRVGAILWAGVTCTTLIVLYSIGLHFVPGG
jgi:Prokaryotic Cytochrome C oxidase subunit IV